MSTALTYISSLIAQLPSGKSNFNNVSNYDMNDMSFGQWCIFTIVFLTLLFILMFLGTMIFNLTIPKIVPSIQKVKTIDFFGLYVILHILFC